MSAIGQQRVLGRLEGEDQKQKIEVIVRRTEASSNLEIRSLSWGKGVGWYVHKTIILDSTQARMLVHVLRQASVLGGGNGEKGKIIPFPARREA